MKTVKLKQIGYRIGGISLINMWGGGQGEIEMDSEDIIGTILKDKIIKCVNDGRFGCESIESANVNIFDLFEGDYTEFNRMVFLNKKQLINCKRGI